MSGRPVVNITMPVFNRYETTQKAILALRKSSRRVPFCLTVVDNGSDAALRKRLIELKEASFIDNLFMLPRNMGISCAANIGWELIDAPYYMKLDNDIVIHEPAWLEKLFRLWSHGEPLSTLGGAYNMDMLLQHTPAMQTDDGVLGTCKTNLPGHAILIPKAIFNVLGYWTEDYGLYGAEDGDYGFRMNCAGFPQYYYHAPDFLTDMGKTDNQEIYLSQNLDKSKEHASLFCTEDGRYGLFPINGSLFSFCIRTWKTVRKLKIVDIHNKYEVVVKEREEYTEFRKDLEECAAKINRRYGKLRDWNTVFSGEFIQELKEIMARTGNDCAALHDGAPGGVNK